MSDERPDLAVGDIGRSDESVPDGEEGFDAKELKFIEALSQGETIKTAGKRAGFAYTTARRVRKRPAVMEAIRERAREAMQAGTLSLGQGAADAAKSLRAIAKGDEAAEGPRVSACRSILELGLRVLEVEDLNERLSRLEAQLAQQPGGLTQRRD